MFESRPLPEDTRIAGYFEDVYAALTARGVPEDRLPTPWAILSHVLDCVDYEALGEWIENYSALESLDTVPEDADEDADADGEDSDEDADAPKRRPSYLRALPGSGHARVPVPTEPEPED